MPVALARVLISLARLLLFLAGGLILSRVVDAGSLNDVLA